MSISYKERMLDSKIKKIIDTARDILVGKIPAPNTQVEQITLAMLYKFMDDMDKISINMMGGKASFFSGEFEKYSWNEIMASKVGAQLRFNLYSEAIEKFYSHPTLPQTFRDIFKNASIPYKDPEILTMFLKEIDKISYDNDSEVLGDAYEYLISILGSQGKLGQFRTPRHIIDFITELVDPKKDSTILDPACGTAGFLISAYKHILKENTDKVLGDKLNYDEKRNVLNNITGYDIEPSMIKIAEMNMFLHGCQNPDIYEYDTLTSEDKWDEKFDVILANPPFMTPKGGITPHKRFSIKANRAEVLFVDYIAEHLKREGRAGIIVPEGIVFQSGTAYKQLRKTLLENSLYAVISLPSGVFQPYSGVKTSILLLDKKFAKETENILFLKVENDGYSLGSQRKEVAGSDLSKIVKLIKQYRQTKKTEESSTINIVSKKDILESDDLSLVGDRYKKSIKASKKIKYFKIEEICDVVKEKTKEGVTPYIEIGDINIDKNDYADKDKPTVKGAIKVQKNDILISKVRPTRGAVALAKNDSNASNAFCIIRAKDINKINIKYIYFNIYKNSNFFEYLGANSKGATYPTCSDADILNYEIPVPPIEIQNQIVQEIEQYQKIIDGAKQVVENWKPVIEIAPEWEEVELGEILIRKKDKVDPRKKAKEEVIYIGLENIESNTGNLQGELTNKYSEIKSIKNVFENANILYGTLRPNLNKVICPKFSGICSTDILVLEPIKNNIKTDFYCYFMRQQVFNEQVIKGVSGAQLPRVSYDYIKNLKLPFPNIDEQILILNGIQEEEKIIVQNKKIIGIYEAKIKEKINKIWNE